MAVEVKSVRMSDATAARIKEIGAELGMTQGQTFDVLVQLYEGEQIRAAVPGRVDEMDVFEAALSKLRGIYQTSVSMYADARELAAADMRREMTAKDDTIAALTAELKHKQEALSAALKRVGELEIQVAEMEARGAREASLDAMQAQLTALAAAIGVGSGPMLVTSQESTKRGSRSKRGGKTKPDAVSAPELEATEADDAGV